MTKFILRAGLIVSLATFGFGTVSVKLKSGLAYLDGSDYNAGLRGTFAYLGDTIGNVTGDVRALHFGLDLGGELIIALGDDYGIGIGAGYIRASRESRFDLDWMLVSSRQVVKPAVRIIPLTLNLHRVLSWGGLLRLDVFAGPGFYLAWFDSDSSLVTNFFSYEQTQAFTARKNALGAQGGLGLEFALGSHMAFVAQVEGRWLVLSDIQGDWEEQGTWFLGSWNDKQSGATFWAYDLSETGKTYPLYAFSRSRPAGTANLNVRKGQLNLSGASLSAGIKLTF